MRTLLRILVLFVIIAAAYLYWRQSDIGNSSILGAVPSWKKVSELWAPAPPNLSSRKWTHKDNRSFEGSLIAADNEAVIIHRTSDPVLLKIDLNTLSESDQAFTHEQVISAKYLGLKLASSVHKISRKLEIKGSLTKIREAETDGGHSISRVDPMYWLLLARPLKDGQSARWVRVDEKTFRSYTENTLVSNEDLTRFVDDKGVFPLSLPWPRPELTLIEARYGMSHKSANYGATDLDNPNAGAENVTYDLMRLISEGKLPMEVSGIFPWKGNELSVVWRTPSGEVRQSLRDGSMLTWP